MDFIVDFLLNFYGPVPYFLIFLILLACGLGLPIPEDVTLFAAGLLAYYGVCDIWILIALCLLGVMLGDSIIFYLGHRHGRKLMFYWPFRTFLNEESLEKVRLRLQKQGNKVLFAARFMPGLRAPIFFSAGVLHLPYRWMLIYDGSAALISVPAIIYTVFYFGDQLEGIIRLIKRIEGGIIGVIGIIVLGVALKWYFREKKHKKK